MMNIFAAIPPYGGYLKMMSHDIPGVFEKLILLLVFLIFFIVSGLYLPAWLKGKSAPSQAPTDEKLPEIATGPPLITTLTYSILGGVMNCLTCWVLSYFLTKSLWAGVALSLPLTIWGLMKAKSLFPIQLDSKQKIQFSVVTFFALLLGLWHHGIVGNTLTIPSSEGKEPSLFVLFNDMQGDVGLHLHSATLIQEQGLPEVETYGSLEHQYSLLTNFGHSTLIAGCTTITKQDVYSVQSALWMLGYLMLGWIGLCCLQKYDFSTDITIAAAICPLLWGQLGFPNLRLLLTPSKATNLQGWENQIAGYQYQNFSHLWSVIFGFGFLLFYQKYLDTDKSPRFWIAALFTLVVCGWMKPFLFFVLGPALLIALIVNRSTVKEWFALGAIVLFGFIVQFLGVLLSGVELNKNWIYTLNHKDLSSYIMPNQWAPLFTLWALGIGIGLLFGIFQLRSLPKSFREKKRLDWGALASLGCLGSLIFALVFRELSFDPGTETLQPNLKWVIVGMVTLLSPYLIVWLASEQHWKLKHRMPTWLRTIAILFVALQLVNGVVCAAFYPLAHFRMTQKQNKEVLQAAKKLSPPDARFFSDQLLDNTTVFAAGTKPLPRFDLYPYLARPVAYRTAIIPSHEMFFIDRWHEFCQTGEESSMMFVNRRDHLIIKDEKLSVIKTLEKNHWSKKEDLSNGYELWVQDPDYVPISIDEINKRQQERAAQDGVSEEGAHKHDHDHDHNHEK